MTPELDPLELAECFVSDAERGWLGNDQPESNEERQLSATIAIAYALIALAKTFRPKTP
jgi:hypothetical protein